MSQRYYDTAILGATFLGIGAALNSKNAIVIEKGEILGAEFIGSYKVCTWRDRNLKTESGDHFERNLRKRGLISENGDFYQGPAMYVVSEYLKEKPVELLLMTEIIEVKKEGGYYHITCYHAKGFEMIVAKHLLDTTVGGIGQKRAKNVEMSKTLNSIIYNPNKCAIEDLSYNSASRLYTYVMPVSVEKSRQEAIEDLCKKEGLFLNHDMKISSIATEFSYTLEACNQEVDERFRWNPSAAYTNLVEAFDMGAYIAERMRKNALA